ncbi:hypothetical protein ABEB36_009566 [Hypothenemus hampei]|uniref:Uncharacterized protein n=1 Tax=Hypothenemus hampei TaxID=57062 RepID=A0ABD1EHD1_HYPHA
MGRRSSVTEGSSVAEPVSVCMEQIVLTPLASDIDLTFLQTSPTSLSAAALVFLKTIKFETVGYFLYLLKALFFCVIAD